MFRSRGKLLLIGAVLAAMLLLGASQADAFWGRCRAVCSPCYTVSCYTPCYTACYVPCYTTCYTPCCTISCGCCCDSCCGCYVGCRPYTVRRSCCGPWYQRYCGSCCTWLSCCSEVCCCDSGTETSIDAVEESTPTPADQPGEADQPDVPADTPAPTFEPMTQPPSGVPGTLPEAPPVTTPPATTPPATVPATTPSAFPPFNPTPPATPGTGGFPSTSSRTTPESSGLLTIYVPYDAKVTINGLPTRSQGSRRKYVSYGLKAGYSYKYEIRAEIERAGQPVVENRTVVMTPGDEQTVAFGFNPSLTEGLASR